MGREREKLGRQPAGTKEKPRGERKPMELGQHLLAFPGWGMVAVDPGLSRMEHREPGEVRARAKLPAKVELFLKITHNTSPKKKITPMLTPV